MYRDCLQHHRKLGLSRRHSVVEGSNSFVGSIVKVQTSSDTLGDECEIHPDEVVKHYCHDHYLVGCGSCIVEHHRTCHIDPIANLAESWTLCDASSDCHQLENEIGELADKIESGKILCKNAFVDSMEAIDSFHTEIIKHLKKHVHDLTSKVQAIKDKREHDFGKIATECQDIKKQARHLEIHTFKRKVHQSLQSFCFNKKIEIQTGTAENRIHQ